MDWSLIASAAADEPSFWASAGSWLLGTLWTVGSVCAGLGFVIFVHELGHFLVAKACGVKCDKFYIGFDIPISIFGFKLPSKLFHFTYGETEYGVGILPLGGYVKMLGQDDDPRNAEAEAERTKIIKDGKAAEGLTPGQTVGENSQEVILDPRSYPAKPIPARMAIISAGVIMNAIFAVILAAIAYRLGVPYIPAVIGSTVVGSPAWQAGLQPGDKVIRIGKNRNESEHLRFRDDLTKHIIFNGYDRDLEIEIQGADGVKRWATIRPVKSDSTGKASLGVRPINGMRVFEKQKKFEHLDAVTSVPLEGDDKLISVDGKEVNSWVEVTPILATKFAEPLELVFERQGKDKNAPAEKISATVQPRKRRTLGLRVQGNEIAAIRKGSNGDVAGLQVGDRIITIDGQPLGEVLGLNQRLVAKAGTEITLNVQRMDGKTAKDVEIKVTPATPQSFHSAMYANKEAVSVETLGIGLATTLEIEEVLADSPAAKAGLQPKDVLIEARLANADGQRLKDDLAAAGRKSDNDLFVFDPKKGQYWQQFMSLVELIHPTTSIKLTYKRGSETRTADVPFTEADDLYDESRGLQTLALQETRIVGTNSEAIQLGFRETKERLEEVLMTLSHLGTGRINVTDLSGLPGIFVAAGSAANVGISSLLIFLTLLSANLAIINFLPIPALDGGHMVFLTWEWIRGKPVDPNTQGYLTAGALVGLLLLMVVATVSDVQKLIEIFF